MASIQQNQGQMPAESENSTAAAEESLKELIMKVEESDQLIAQYELYEIDQQHLNKFEAEITQAVTFLDVIEVIKKMVDVLFAHINNLTKDLYEFSQYDVKQGEQNTQLCIERLEKEIKVHSKMQKEQEIHIKNLERENMLLKEETTKHKEISKVSQNNVDANGYKL